METEVVEKKALTIVDQAKTAKVTDVATYTAAGELWKSIGDMMKEVSDTFDGIIKKAHEAHKEALAKKAKFYDPLAAAHKNIKRLMSDYDAEQERLRLAEQKRLGDLARKAAEEQALLEAIAAEEEARNQGATPEQAAQEAEAVIAAPVYVPPVVLPKATPKLAGGPVYRSNWTFRIDNMDAIPRQYMIPDEVKIRQVVKALKLQHGIPGITAYEERV